MNGVRLHLRPAEGRQAAVAAALFAAGAEALQELDGALITTAEHDASASALERAARAADPGLMIERHDDPHVDWSVAWRSQIRAHTVGYLTVAPPWLAAPFLPNRTIVIEPAMAFGTGDHATTRGVLKLMQDVVKRDDLVADLGAGSAVLAIGAAKLGAKRVVAIENDPDAIGNAELNVAANEVGDIVTVLEGDALVLLPLVAPVRVVLANIISSVIRELMPAIANSLEPNGVAIFSGMLVAEGDEMNAVFAAAGFSVRAEVREGEWLSVAVERTAG